MEELPHPILIEIRSTKLRVTFFCRRSYRICRRRSWGRGRIEHFGAAASSSG
jgi:hypothetical protein